MFSRRLALSAARALGAAGAVGAAGVGVAPSLAARDINYFQESRISQKKTSEIPAIGKGAGTAVSTGEISTHVISKLGKQSVSGSTVRVYHHADFTAGVLSPGWTFVGQATLSDNGGIDDLVPPGTMKLGLYMIEFDFGGIDAAARDICKKEGGKYVPMNPNGFFLAAKSCITLKVEDASSLNHLVLSVGDKEITARPGVRAH